jgi:LytS/YehU family sensor histidine kinase
MFNTLNSIYAMSLKKSEQTSEAILKLSQLMRYILVECSQPTVDLRKEVEVLQSYIKLEKGRFNERVDMSVNIQGDLNNNKIAPLLLLPFLENSFKHGANEMIEQAWITLDLEVDNKDLRFKLLNGRSNGTDHHPDSAYVGLQNVKKRLNLLYPDAHELRITEDADTYMVLLTLKLDQIQPVEG